FYWERHLQVDGWRRQLDQHGAAKFRAHRENYHRSEEQRHGLRLRARKIVERQRGSRRLQDDRRWQELEQDSEGRESLDGLLDDLHEFARSENAFRGHVGLPAEGLDFPVGRRECHGGERQRIFSNHGWRSYLERIG